MYYRNNNNNANNYKRNNVGTNNPLFENYASTNQRNNLLKDFRNNKYQIAFTVNMFNEGVDFPDVETVLMLRPTDSLTIFIQQIMVSYQSINLKILD